ncbi:hypothetical protein PAXRUDRAFT_624614 [Paxillus rubicundulus Ve08.2h10]|uniref:G domain-containing protein n=1 Tax=Paxillus rubicundulus Ve08.2h10 TaxID=930991 RepID=A0A0D0DYB5_9AGAM|nr:hypothetical protein PAXRUDRAFT_624614 [Paxillus rubicundulus Ve08.2h10]
MAATNQLSQPRNRPLNIVFFGQSGAGKSSTINLIAGSSITHTSNDTGPCTRVSACYKATIHDEAFNLWDTGGLGEGFFHSLFKGSPGGELKKFLRERYQKHEIDLLVYCIHGAVEHRALVMNYNTFCLTTRRLAAPIVIVVTNLERLENMENWWEDNKYSLQNLGMEFDGHACITALADHPQTDVSKTTLYDLITRDYPWQAECHGSYFGPSVPRWPKVATTVVPRSIRRVYTELRRQSPPLIVAPTRRAQSEPFPAAAHPHITPSEARSSPSTRPYGADLSTVSTPSGKSKIADLRKKVTQNWGTRQSLPGKHSNSGADALVHRAPVPTCSSSHTAQDQIPQDSNPTTPVVGPVSRSQVVHATLPVIMETVPPQPFCEESDSATSHLHSMFRPSSGASGSSRSELHLQPLVGGNGVLLFSSRTFTMRLNFS